MRWVTYLSPSGGGARPGVVDDGCVFGYPGEQSLPELLAGGGDALAEAYQRALDSPVEIIVEFEARLCAPLRPAAPIPVLAREEQLTVAPTLVRGTDDGVTLPPGADGLTASVGVAAVLGGRGLHTGCAPVCLWRAPDGTPAWLTLGPAVVTRDELPDSVLTVAAAVADSVLTSMTTEGDASWTEGLQGDVMARLSAPTRILEPGDELFVDGGPLGEFEIRVDAGA
ncbi:hypothetical protein [Halostreptopolyspora alba]|uniref:Uncharacterized protein n=1 Tax=Halostreptopolyspora alba TaxID=2487137 RepID=A0A3N0E703_9ACTN|nr:hypothetical protein EFW17_15350 [Nocardiopsaceae bacterium YIM 96095]